MGLLSFLFAGMLLSWKGSLLGMWRGCLFVLRFADGMLPGGCWWLRGGGLVGVGVLRLPVIEVGG